MQRTGKVLTDIKHGGDTLDSGATGAQSRGMATEATAFVAADDAAALAAVEATVAVADAAVEEVTFETPFGYMFPDLTNDPDAHLPADNPAKIVAALKALGDAMVEDSLAPGEDPLQPTANSTIPPLYTYWGQFIDHDLTANTDRDSEISNITLPNLTPIDPQDVVERLFNLRQPTVNLDSVYGDGPTFFPSRPTVPIMSGEAIATSNSNQPSSIRFTRSSPPTSSAPARSASWAFSPWAKTMTRVVLPVPCGRTTVPRTSWSAWRGSTPRRRWASTVPSNLLIDSFGSSSAASAI